MLREARSALQKLFRRFGYRIVRLRDFPQGDLIAFCSHLSTLGFRPRHILDVGANDAGWSRAVRTVFPMSRFTLVEPQIEMRPFLDRFCAETEGARWINAGAGAVASEMNLTMFPDTFSSTFALTEDEARALGFPQRSVEIVTLDHVCQDLIGAIPDLIKLDVEGFEYEVLKGSQTLLGKTELILLELTFFGEFENAKAPHEMFAIMADFGYRTYDFTWFQRRPYDRALGQCEVAFARTNGYLRSHLGWD